MPNTIIHDRIKCSATIDSSGLIVVGAAKAGFNALSSTCWNTSGSEETGEYPYLLEDGSGGWETGFVRVASYGTAPVTNAGKGRFVTNSNMNAGAGFSNGASGLTLSQGPFANGAVNMSSTDFISGRQGSAEIAGGAVAMTTTYGLAIGYGTDVHGVTGSVAVGRSAKAGGWNNVALGASAVAPNGCDGAVQLGPADQRAYSMQIAIKGTITTGTTAAVVDGGNRYLNITDLAQGDDSYAAGPVRVRGVMTLNGMGGYKDSAYMKIISYEYVLFLNDTGTTRTVLGTPTFTTLHTGASAPTSTVSVDTTTGVPQINNTSGADIKVYGMMYLDLMNIWGI